MKKLILITLTLFTVMFTSCEKENCRDTVLGTYIGTATSDGGATNDDLNITINTGNDEKDAFLVFSTPSIPNSPDITLSGNLNLDCTILTIPEQVIIGNTISGSFTISGSNLKGTLFSNGNATVIDCSK